MDWFGLINSAKNIYNHLQDEESKHIFENRMLYTFTGDYGYIWNMVAGLPIRRELDHAVAFCKEHVEEVVVYGAGNDFSMLSVLYPDFKIRRLCDGDTEKQQKGWHGIPVMPPEELIRIKDNVYVAVNTYMYHKEIIQFLLKNGFQKEKIIDLQEMVVPYCSRQYFDTEIIKPGPEEIFVDGGCFDCLTDKAFVKWCSGNYKKIYAFEPDLENYQRCQKESEKEIIENMILYHKGLWNCETKLSFQEAGSSTSKIGEGTTTISTVALDDIVGDDKVTFIKLDIEGAELEALQGAKRTIQTNRPRMAICIYHKSEDIVTIPEYILSLRNDYKLYIRHYTLNDSETVIYAV